MIEDRIKVIETRTTRFWLENDGIIRFAALPVKSITLDDAEENWAAVLELSQGVVRPIFGDIRAVRGINREARKFYAENPVGTIVCAIGMQVDSPISRMVGSLFLGLNKLPVPVKLFTKEFEAVDWLKGFIHND